MKIALQTSTVQVRMNFVMHDIQNAPADHIMNSMKHLAHVFHVHLKDIRAQTVVFLKN